MMKNNSNSLDQLRSSWPSWALNLLFYGSVCWIIAISELPPIKEPVFLLRQHFLASNKTLFALQDPGLRFAIFEPYRTNKDRVSFLMDTPYDSDSNTAEQLQAAQGRLAPLLLNPDPVEKTAFIFCSKNAIANIRMQENGYRVTRILGDGKMIAEKIS